MNRADTNRADTEWLGREAAYLAWHLAAGRAALAERYWREWIEHGERGVVA
ncbi:hypothetical protein [Halomonas sp. NO4]|uniref:hypothetical protein n=1 Tax=Halomonas sp. NO4 TaxID=2484813 RepID=UPI0013D181BA|nr:hypothetical protein [Halomonas sp. NO4]